MRFGSSRSPAHAVPLVASATNIDTVRPKSFISRRMEKAPFRPCQLTGGAEFVRVSLMRILRNRNNCFSNEGKYKTREGGKHSPCQAGPYFGNPHLTSPRYPI